MSDKYPKPHGHTDQLGYWHPGSPQGRAEGQKEENRRWWKGVEKAEREKTPPRRDQERER